MIEFVVHVLRIAFIGAFAWWLSGKVETVIKRRLDAAYPDHLIFGVLAKFIGYLIMFAAAVAMLSELGISVGALIGAAGLVGVAVGLAAKASVANIISGLFLIIEAPFKLGDTLVIEEHEGKVMSFDLFSVTLKNESQQYIRVPNQKVIKSIIINKSRA